MNALMSQAQISDGPLSRRPSRSWSVAILVATSLFATVGTGCGSKSTAPSATPGASGTSTATSSATSGATSTSGATPTSGAALPQAAQVIAQSVKQTKTLHSVHIALTATNVPTLQVSNVNADVTNLPQSGGGRAVGDAQFRLTPDAPFVPTSFVVQNKTFYTKNSDGSYKSVGPSEKIYDPGVILDTDKGLSNVISNVQNPQVQGRETINGVATVKVTGTIDPKVTGPVVPGLGKGGGPMPITLWIADEPTPTTPLPSDAAAPSSGPNLVRMEINKDQGSVDVTLSAWSQPVTIPNATG